MPNPHIERFNMFWKKTTQEDRKKLIKGLGFHDSFSVCDSLQEMAERDGAWLAKELLKFWKKKEEAV